MVWRGGRQGWLVMVPCFHMGSLLHVSKARMVSNFSPISQSKLLVELGLETGFPKSWSNPLWLLWVGRMEEEGMCDNAMVLLDLQASWPLLPTCLALAETVAKAAPSGCKPWVVVHSPAMPTRKETLDPNQQSGKWRQWGNAYLASHRQCKQKQVHLRCFSMRCPNKSRLGSILVSISLDTGRLENRVLQGWTPESHVDISSVFCVGQDPLYLSPGLLAALPAPRVKALQDWELWTSLSAPSQGSQHQHTAHGKWKIKKACLFIGHHLFQNKKGGEGPSPQGNKAQTLSVTKGF